MNNHKKTLIGSIVAFLLAFSCCWITSLAVWLGGTGLVIAVLRYVEDIRIMVLLAGVLLGLTSIYLKYRKNGKNGKNG